jgi:hypothetical protein
MGLAEMAEEDPAEMAEEINHLSMEDNKQEPAIVANDWYDGTLSSSTLRSP